jgi:lysophospholipase L1-like esterase
VRKRRNRLSPTGLLAFFLACFPVRAAEILVVGDSWAEPIGYQLRAELAERGHAHSNVWLTNRWGKACTLVSPEGLDQVSAWIGQYPELDFVHFSLGGNDLLDNWVPEAGLEAEDELVDEIAACMEGIFDHVLSIRADIQLVWSSYDYLRPIIGGPWPWAGSVTPQQVNRVLDKLAKAAARLAATKGPNIHTVDIIGTLQTTYGFDGVQHSDYDPPYPIPADDPSLPDPQWPSPSQAFNWNDPTHPIRAANRALAEAQYKGLYESFLVDQVFQINAGLNDAWFNTATNGQGFLITVFPTIEQMFLAWFTFDTERPPEDVEATLGEPGHRWLTAQGPYEGDTATLSVYVTEGGIFDAGDPAAANDGIPDGKITIEFADCTEGLVTYEIISPSASGEIPIQRISNDNVAFCESLTDQ